MLFFFLNSILFVRLEMGGQ